MRSRSTELRQTIHINLHYYLFFSVVFKDGYNKTKENQF